MSLFVIGDTHLSLGTDKPMDVFGGWQDYVNRLSSNWQKVVKNEDMVVIAGDISWAMTLDNCFADFSFLHSLPGKKILLKGNHDYWWTSMKKMNEYCEKNGFSSINFLHNNCFFYGDYALCGSRSWFFDVSEPQDDKVMRREIGRLKASFEAAGDKPIIAFLHYPPIYGSEKAHQVLELIEQYNVKKVFYGHLHGKTISYAFNGVFDGVEYKLISADSVDFCPYYILS